MASLEVFHACEHDSHCGADCQEDVEVPCGEDIECLTRDLC